MWIVVADGQSNAGSTNFYVFQLDSSGQLTYHQTYTASAALVVTSVTASPNGRMIAVSFYSGLGYAYGISYLTFDKALGDITNYTSLFAVNPPYPPNRSSPYPIFSPNSRFLYYPDICCYSQAGNVERICQSDLYNLNPFASRKFIYQYNTENNGIGPFINFCNGPDKKIYIGREPAIGNAPLGMRLGVINFPDVIENGTNSTGYNSNGPDIVPANSPYQSEVNGDGFGGFSDRNDAYGCNWQPGVPKPFSYFANGCLNYQFYSDECWGAQWNFGDTLSGAANTSALSLPAHNFTAPGNYAVKLIINGYTFVDTIHITAPVPQIAATPITPCPVPLANYSIANIQPFVNYVWQVTNGTPALTQGQNNIDVSWNTADTSGTIIVIAMDTVMGCVDTAVLHVSYSLGDSISINHIAASVCAGGSYPFNKLNLTVAGNYADTILLPGGCRSVNLLTLSVDAPTATWPGGTDTLNTSGTITLSGGSPTGGVYSGPGVTGNTFNPAQANAGANIVTYTYTDGNGCPATATRTFVVLGVSNISLEEQINLYPNPANNTITAQSPLFASGLVQITLYDITGRLIAVPVYRDGDKATFNISGIANGVYWFRFAVNSQNAAKRFVKME